MKQPLDGEPHLLGLDEHAPVAAPPGADADAAPTLVELRQHIDEAQQHLSRDADDLSAAAAADRALAEAELAAAREDRAEAGAARAEAREELARASVALADAVRQAEALASAAQAEARSLREAAAAEGTALQAELLAELEEDAAARFEQLDARAAALATREAALGGAVTGPSAPAALAPGSDDEDRLERRPRGRWVRVLCIALLVLAVLAASQLIRAFVFTPFTIASTSMAPEIDPRDRLLVNRLAYRFADPERGDVVAIEGSSASSDRPLVKRVVGLPGEVVRATRGELLVDGRPVDERWLPPGTETSSFGPVTVPEDSVFLLGDNRDESSDSRVFGPVPLDALVGRVEFVYWPPENAGDL